MARDYSDEYVRSLRFPNYPLVHAGIAARSLIRRVRRLQRLALQRSGTSASPIVAGDTVGPGLEAASAHFQEHGWAFVDPFFDESFHRDLIAGWPSRAYLEPPSNILKGYDTGFGWRRSRPQEPKYLDQHPAVGRLLQSLRSKEFGQRVSKFANSPNELTCFSFLATQTWPGSAVAPHRDTVAYTPQGKHFLNFVMFVNGTGGERSGGLAILKDATFQDVIFESGKLWNTALIYASGAPFFHGFTPVRWGKFRWAIAAQFCDESYTGVGD